MCFSLHCYRCSHYFLFSIFFFFFFFGGGGGRVGSLFCYAVLCLLSSCLLYFCGIQNVMFLSSFYELCLLLLPLFESVIVLCFVVRYFMSILVLQSS